MRSFGAWLQHSRKGRFLWQLFQKQDDFVEEEGGHFTESKPGNGYFRPGSSRSNLGKFLFALHSLES